MNSKYKAFKKWCITNIVLFIISIIILIISILYIPQILLYSLFFAIITTGLFTTSIVGMREIKKRLK